MINNKHIIIINLGADSNEVKKWLTVKLIGKEHNKLYKN